MRSADPRGSRWVGARTELAVGLLVLLRVSGLLGVAGLEAGHAATGVEDLLLAGVEGVAVGAHVGVDPAGRGGAAGGERVTAGAADLGLDVLRVDVGLHGCPLDAPRVAPLLRAVNRSRRVRIVNEAEASHIPGCPPAPSGRNARFARPLWRGLKHLWQAVLLRGTRGPSG